MAEPVLEKHYSIQEIAEQWSLSEDFVRKIFFDEPGVLKIGKGSRLIGGRAKKLLRHYFLLRVPESVFLRVQNRLMHKRPADSGVPAVRLRNAGNDVHAAG